MTYKLHFITPAEKEWKKLGATVREQFKKKLVERLGDPRVAADTLHGMTDHYQIKLRTSWYRLVYRVSDDIVTVTVVAVGKREKADVYSAAKSRQR